MLDGFKDQDIADGEPADEEEVQTVSLFTRFSIFIHSYAHQPIVVGADLAECLVVKSVSNACFTLIL